MNSNVLLVFTSLLSSALSAENLTNECPEFDGAPNCYCAHKPDDQFPVIVTCKGIPDAEELLQSIQELKGYKIDHLQLIEARVPTWPADLFKDISVDFLHIEDSDVENWAAEGGSSVFAGLETSLKYLSLMKLPNITSWDWSLLAVANSLRALSVVLTPLENLPSAFSSLGNGQVLSVSLMGTEMSSMDEDVFVGLRNVTAIRLNSNKLSELKRSMFPNPAPELMEISLMLNEISDLPEDMFTEMPNLSIILLDHNKLTHLPEAVFSPIWKQLSTLSINGNPLHCDCKFLWLVNATKTSVPPSNDFSWVTCESPPNLKGRELAGLKMEELKCSEDE